MLGEASNLKSQGVNAPFLQRLGIRTWRDHVRCSTVFRVLCCLHLADNSAGMGSCCWAHGVTQACTCQNEAARTIVGTRELQKTDYVQN